MHCRGGIGRAGLIAACVLLNLGLVRTGDEAIAEVSLPRDDLRPAVLSFAARCMRDALIALRALKRRFRRCMVYQGEAAQGPTGRGEQKAGGFCLQLRDVRAGTPSQQRATPGAGVMVVPAGEGSPSQGFKWFQQHTAPAENRTKKSSDDAVVRMFPKSLVHGLRRQVGPRTTLTPIVSSIPPDPSSPPTTASSSSATGGHHRSGARRLGTAAGGPSPGHLLAFCNNRQDDLSATSRRAARTMSQSVVVGSGKNAGKSRETAGPPRARHGSGGGGAARCVQPKN